MQEQELMGLAASAVGFIDDQVDDTNSYGLRRDDDGAFYVANPQGWRPWLPREDDGDSLRLAVKLGVRIYTNDWIVKGKTKTIVDHEKLFTPVVVEHNGDAEHATREAIFLAAVELGKKIDHPTRPKQKFLIGDDVLVQGWAGNAKGKITGIDWVFHHRMSEWVWGYSIDFVEGQNPFTFEFIPQGYLKKEENHV